MADKVVVILGPTASGKTGVAIEIATALDSLSSRTSLLESASAQSTHQKCASFRSSTLPRISSKLTLSKMTTKAEVASADARVSSDALAASNKLDDQREVLSLGGAEVIPADARVSSDALAASNKLDDRREILNLGGAEVISADSRAIYKGMDIGTAKPSAEEQAGVKHWGIDLVEPGERFTVADWKEYAEHKISEIRNRGNLPMVVGGTGLYVDALVYDYKFTEQKKLSQDDRRNVCTNYLLIGVKTEPEILRQRITERADKLFTQELFEETKKLVQTYGWGSQAMTSNIYQFAWGYLQGEYSLDRAKELFVYDDWHLAKRQMTWFKRNKNINWLPLAEIRDFVLKCIQDEQRN